MLETYEEWQTKLENIETSAIEIVKTTFKTSPLGCVALSLQKPKNLKKDWKDD